MTFALSPLWLTLIGIVAARQLWIYFVCAMRLKMVHDAGQLTRGQTVLGYSALVEGLVLDALFHFIFGTLIFLELPARKEWTLSARLWRLSNGPPSWRQRLALKVRKGLLDSIDPSGVHR
ncbi:hypothetical protein [Variovorax ginsengisoli]|uniref:Uncharacterized protein n=1 Tax=Variovorax ginsengisoli TaxID=363844 RepID=A0ABT8SDY2_9BURK|nr:hypothetical protein [Variovorax ginsengisoli]MDN8617883.1 hypothetical protein [Variovorax ginsengisoli]MDO1537053.1 hypothetical protein [Variovorax ginsengisoli]